MKLSKIIVAEVRYIVVGLILPSHYESKLLK